MIIVTGAAGFVGANLVRGLNRLGHHDILAVDDLTDGDKFVNLVGAQIADYMHKDEFRARVSNGTLPSAHAVLHQGACSDTTERNGHFMMDNNYLSRWSCLSGARHTRRHCSTHPRQQSTVPALFIRKVWPMNARSMCMVTPSFCSTRWSARVPSR